eukprot:15024495-Ditylum_brightwellii.AAC.1
MNCCCVQLNSPPSTQATKHLQLIRTCVTAATPVQESQQQDVLMLRAVGTIKLQTQQQSMQCASIHRQQQATQQCYQQQRYNRA